MPFKKLVLLSIVVTLVCCKKKPVPDPHPEIKGTYFSIMQFAGDQWTTYHGMPFGLVKIVSTNGKTDSSYVSALTMDWGTDVLKPFFESDISNRKYLGHYRFSSFDDDLLGTRTYAYDAIDDDLFTRKLYISFNPENNKIVSIYIETQKQSNAKTITQKLLYKPLKLIQIQEFEGASMGAKMETEVKYIFL